MTKHQPEIERTAPDLRDGTGAARPLACGCVTDLRQQSTTGFVDSPIRGFAAKNCAECGSSFNAPIEFFEDQEFQKCEPCFDRETLW